VPGRGRFAKACQNPSFVDAASRHGTIAIFTIPGKLDVTEVIAPLFVAIPASSET
jgi:hypothetical protein